MLMHLAGNMDGVGTVERIRSLYKIPVIFLTAYPDETIPDFDWVESENVRRFLIIHYLYNHDNETKSVAEKVCKYNRIVIMDNQKNDYTRGAKWKNLRYLLWKMKRS